MNDSSLDYILQGLFTVTLYGAGGGVAWFVVRLILPIIKSSWDNTLSNNRAEKDMIERLQQEVREKNDSIDGYREREKEYMKMVAEMALIKYQLELANKRIEELSA